jgi:geranylgeranyl pyrophosphate synthase
MTFDLQRYLAANRERVDAALERYLPPATEEGAGDLAAAMRHAVLGGGKRLRPVTVVAACEAAGGSWERALPGACAVELVHAYSLVHDDLPAMDDDDERRGRPTVHVAFDEATAVLAGDALLTLAFEVLAIAPRPAAQQAPDPDPTRRLAAVRELAERCGHAGLVGGQALDMASGDEPLQSVEQLERIHRGKTAALFAVSAAIGGHLASADPAAQQHLVAFGEALGLAFQHADDILDDEHQHLAGQTADRLHSLLETARDHARRFDEAGQPLVGLADLVEAYAAKG